ncbi:MAG: rod-binding protein [Heliobacteriaceae bacterium]|nr:rod-binding protein [Heliobacteriaceae bacterium]MDD4587507.1 rod-binding protein [Heliobacteriaceae bacterium]
MFPPEPIGKPGGNLPGLEKERRQLKERCQDFEAMFIYELLKGLRQTVPRSGLVPEMPGRSVWETMLDQAYSQQLAKQEDLGLAKTLYQELSRNLK